MSDQATGARRRVIVVADPQLDAAELRAALAALGDLEIVATPEEAIGPQRLRPGDIVVLSARALLGATQAAGLPGADRILERVGQGVLIVDRSGKVLWANPRMQTYPAHAVETVREACTRICAEFAAERGRPDTQRTRRRSVSVDHEFHFDVTASPLLSASEQVEQVVALVWDVTATRRLQEKINAIDAAGRELVRLDAERLAEMDVVERLQVLEDKIIRYSRDLLHFNHFTVRILDRKTNKLETVLAGGMSEEAKNLDIYATPEGNGISGYVAATGRSYICPDVSKDPRYLPGIVNAASSLTVPLRLHDQIVGILNVESDEVAAFTEDDRQIAEIFGGYIAIALHILRLLAVERYATTGQIAADVGAELAIPLNDILTEASTLMEDYIGHDDLRRRLHAVIDNVDKVKRSIKALTEAPAVQGLVPRSAERDPVLDGRRILIAEDEDAIRETVADVLTKGGALVVMARDGDEAIAMIRNQPFDLILSDIRMPGKNGYDVFSAAKQANVQVPVILITGFGYDPNHSIVRASKEGLAGVLFKPFKVEQLLDEVRHALTTKVI
jgi:CheY-like chemotaxis protein